MDSMARWRAARRVSSWEVQARSCCSHVAALGPAHQQGTAERVAGRATASRLLAADQPCALVSRFVARHAHGQTWRHDPDARLGIPVRHSHAQPCLACTEGIGGSGEFRTALLITPHSASVPHPCMCLSRSRGCPSVSHTSCGHTSSPRRHFTVLACVGDWQEACPNSRPVSAQPGNAAFTRLPAVISIPSTIQHGGCQPGAPLKECDIAKNMYVRM